MLGYKMFVFVTNLLFTFYLIIVDRTADIIFWNGIALIQSLRVNMISDGETATDAIQAKAP